jgi:hypothetical protein
VKPGIFFFRRFLNKKKTFFLEVIYCVFVDVCVVENESNASEIICLKISAYLLYKLDRCVLSSHSPYHVQIICIVSIVFSRLLCSL